MAEADGFLSRMSIGGVVVAFVSHDIKEARPLVDDDGLTGTRTRGVERVVQGNFAVAGSIVMQPTEVEWAAILPFVMGNSALLLTDAMTDVTVVVDTKTKSYSYLGRFNTCKITGEKGKKLWVTLGFIGYTCTPGAGGVITTAVDKTTGPLMFYGAGSGITIVSTTYVIDKFELDIDNHIIPTYMSGQSATDLEPQDRTITLGIQTKFNAAELALSALAIAGPVFGTPMTSTIAFTNGTNTLSLAFAAVVPVSETVVVPGRAPLRLPLNFSCYGASTTKELVTTIA